MKRGTKGKFVPNWDSETKKRVSITLTATAWRLLDREAQKLGISRSEVIEQVARSFDRDPEQPLSPPNETISARTTEAEITCSQSNYQHAEEALRQSEQRFRIAQELSLDAFTVLESVRDETGAIVDFKWTYVNPKAAEILKHPVEMLVGQKLLEILPGNKANSELFDRYVRVVESGEPHDIELYYNDNAIAGWFRNMAVKLEDGIAISFCDITERKHTERALQESERRFRRLVESNMFGVAFGDFSGGVHYANDYFLNMVGYTSEEMLAGHIQWVKMTPPEFLPLDEEAIAELRTKGVANPFEKEFLRKDGSRVPISIGSAMLQEPYDRQQEIIAFVLDLTERKQAEARWREGKQTLDAIMEYIPEGITIADALDATIRQVSNYGQQLTGRSRETLIGIPAREQVEKWGLLRADGVTKPTGDELPLTRAVKLSEVVTDEEWILQRPDGSKINLLCNAGPIQDRNGKTTGGIIAWRDITERKQSQEVLRQALQKLNFHIENTPMAVIEWNREMQITRWSGAAERIFGWQADEVLGRLLPDLQMVVEEDVEQVTDVSRRLRIGEESYVFSHNRNYTKQGDIVDCEWYNSSLRDESGRTVSVLSLVLDVTDRYQAEQELRQSEERYRYLAETIPQLVWTADAQGRNSYVNQQMCDYIGLSMEQLLNFDWQLAVHPDDLESVLQQWMESVTNGIPYQKEYRFRRADGMYRWHLVRSIPLKDEKGKAIEWFGVCTDIHEQKELEQQRLRLLEQEKAAREEAERANRIKDEFLAVLSHELRSPLNPILGWAKLLQTKKFDAAKTTEALKTIERNAKLQAELIEDLLDVSRILRGKLSLNVGAIDLRAIVHAAIETVHLSSEAKAIQIETTFEPNIGQVSGDSARLQQIIWNLLSNAIKFTPSGGKVNIRLAQIDAQIQITVSDTGKGISPEFLPFVFDYFRQADSTTTRKFGGLGLGLAIVRHLVELHGGTVRADSPGEGQGATFTVNLPLMLPRSEANQNNGQIDSSLDLNGINILVVDDEADTREFLAFLLEQHGAKLTVVGSASQALVALVQFKPDVLLSDIGMPEMDGYALIEQVRQLSPEFGGQIPAIAVTAYAGEINYQQAMKAGFQHHISKPIEPEALVRVIRECLR